MLLTRYILRSFRSIQSLSRVRLFATPWTSVCQASISVTNSRSWPKLLSTESVMPSNHLILCRPLLLLTSIFPSIRVFSNESALRIRWPEYWSFSISPSNEYSGLISFRMDWLDLLAVQGTLKSRLQHQSSKASILRHSAFFIVQLSHPYMTTGKLRSLEAGKCSLIFEAMTGGLICKFNSYWFIRAFKKHNTCMKDLTIFLFKLYFPQCFGGSFLLLFVIV